MRVAASPIAWLAVAIVTSLAARLASALAHPAPRYFPDEYIYASLARSISRGSLTIRGTEAHFPALLEPLLASPLWLGSSVETAYRLTQGLHAVAVSLAAVPVFLLARRVGLGGFSSVACSAFALATPSLLYAAFITADALAYPLVLGALAAGVSALAKPTRPSQATFAALVLLATFTRVQYVALIPAFVAATLIVERGRPARVLRNYAICWAVFFGPVLAAIATGPTRILGYYRGILDFSIAPLQVVHWIGVDSMLIAFAAGLILVPGAVAGCWLSIRSPRSRTQHAFGALSFCFVSVLFLEAAAYATNGSPRFQERYLFAVLPLVGIAFFLWAQHPSTSRKLVGALALTLGLLALRIPLTGYMALDNWQDSPFLMAAKRLELVLGIGNAALVISVAAAIACCLAALSMFSPRRFAPIAMGIAIAVTACASAGAVTFDSSRSNEMRDTFGDGRGQMSWIDAHRLGGVSVLVTPGIHRPAVSSHLFWNQSVTHVLRLPGAPPIDVFGEQRARIASDGLIIANGRPVRAPVLVEEYAVVGILDNARLVYRSPSASLWEPRDVARMAAMVNGRLLDGWIGRVASITIWPKAHGAIRTGRITFELSLPVGRYPTTAVDVLGPGYRQQVTLRPGVTRAVEVPFRAEHRPVQIELRGIQGLVDGVRVVSAQMSLPRIAEAPVGRVKF